MAVAKPLNRSDKWSGTARLIRIGKRFLLNQKQRITKRSGRDAGNGDQRNIRITAAVRVNPHD